MAFSEKHTFGITDHVRHKIVYNDWGDPKGLPIMCVHGLTGNGHDFDFLAEDLIKHGYRLLCVDLPGRGRSDFLENPLDYNYDQYVQDLNAVLSHEDLDEPGSVDWLGVSLGGLLGIRMAGMDNSVIKRLIVNDVGPVVPQAALDFIYQAISKHYSFDTIQDFEKRLRETRGLTWGPMQDKHWRHMAEHNARALEDGNITYSYDQRISIVFEKEPVGDVNLWEHWAEISVPTLVIQGKQSMLLTDDIVNDMRGSGPAFDHVVFEGCGHVPSLMADNQIEMIRTWLNDT